jgi:hypothetical protein
MSPRLIVPDLKQASSQRGCGFMFLLVEGVGGVGTLFWKQLISFVYVLEYVLENTE